MACVTLAKRSVALDCLILVGMQLLGELAIGNLDVGLARAAQTLSCE